MNKKIFYIANIRLPTEKAHGVQIMKMCEAFAEQGMDVHLVVPKRKTPIKSDPFKYYGVRQNFQITKLWCLDWVGLGWIGFWIEQVSFAKMAVLRTLFKDGIFYTRDEFIAFCLNLVSKKVVWEAHMGQKNFFARRLIRSKIKIITISQGLKDMYLEMGVSESRLSVAHDGVDLKEFSVPDTKEEYKKKLGLPLDKKIVMYAGLLDEWKGYRTLLEASEYLDDDVLVVILGGTDKQVESLRNAYPKASFLGYRPYTELPMNQRAANVLVIPNSGKGAISNRFTSPMKLFAYMASGRPIIASNLPSLREVLDESMATFFEADNARDLARAITASLEEENSDSKTRKALERVREFTWQNRAKEIINFIS